MHFIQPSYRQNQINRVRSVMQLKKQKTQTFTKNKTIIILCKEEIQTASIVLAHRFSSFKRRGVYLILRLLGAAFIRGRRS